MIFSDFFFSPQFNSLQQFHKPLPHPQPQYPQHQQLQQQNAQLLNRSKSAKLSRFNDSKETNVVEKNNNNNNSRASLLTPESNEAGRGGLLMTNQKDEFGIGKRFISPFSPEATVPLPFQLDELG